MDAASGTENVQQCGVDDNGIFNIHCLFIISFNVHTYTCSCIYFPKAGLSNSIKMLFCHSSILKSTEYNVSALTETWTSLASQTAFSSFILGQEEI